VFYPAPGYVSGGGFVTSGGGIGIVYSRRHLSIGAFLGGFGSSRYSSSAVYIDNLSGSSGPPTVIVDNRVTVQIGGEAQPYNRRPTLQEEVGPIDLDQASPGVKLPPPASSLAKLPANLPGQQVSKERPALRPDDLPPKIEAPPPPKAKEMPKQPPEPPPEADPREENTRLVKLGLTAFSSREYGLAAHRFRQATLVEPKSAPAYIFLAQAQFALGKYRQAVDAIHAGMNLTKNWPKAPFQPRLDLYKGAEGDFVVHLKRLQDTLATSPNDPVYLFLTGYQLWFDGRQNDAVELFKQARPLTADRRFIDQFLAAAAPAAVAAK
jgi:hypothetical protein